MRPIARWSLSFGEISRWVKSLVRWKPSFRGVSHSEKVSQPVKSSLGTHIKKSCKVNSYHQIQFSKFYSCSVIYNLDTAEYSRFCPLYWLQPLNTRNDPIGISPYMIKLNSDYNVLKRNVVWRSWLSLHSVNEASYLRDFSPRKFNVESRRSEGMINYYSWRRKKKATFVLDFLA